MNTQHKYARTLARTQAHEHIRTHTRIAAYMHVHKHAHASHKHIPRTRAHARNHADVGPIGLLTHNTHKRKIHTNARTYAHTGGIVNSHTTNTEPK